MARQEIASTFSDGLIMDLNPINTPKSVLTDCLNGTYITYNGNEFVLQNDMGNYKLKNCKLPTNFIPVGVKGYGDILYIVSYNPITNETEIGSYPAPQSIFKTDSGSKSSEDNLIKFNINGTNIYNDVIKSQKHPIFIWTDEVDPNIYKLYPGDEFRWQDPIENELSIYTDYIYQHLNFYVIDDDNKLYDIDDEDMYNDSEEQKTEDEFRKVFWETPGWLAAQWDLFVPDKFNLSLRSLNVPEFLLRSDTDTDTQIIEEGKDPANTFRVSMVLSTQTIISDPLFQQTLNKYFDKPVYKHLYIRFILNNPGNYTPDSEKSDEEQLLGEFLGYHRDGGDLEPSENNCIKNADGNIIQYIIDVPCNKHNYQDDITTAYTSGSAIWRFTNPLKDNIANYPGYVECTAYPIIKQKVYDLTDSDNPVIVENKYNVLEFKQFESSLKFELNNLKEPDSITIADQIYKWSVDDDSCTVSFNINGPFINVEGITGKYEIYRINLFNYNNDPQSDSYSTWTSATWKTPDQNPIDFTINPRYYLIKEDDKYTRKPIEGWQNPTTENPNPINEDYLVEGNRPILLCSGDIPSLVLYGQNTLNIDWSTSDKIELSGYENWYKDIDTNDYVLSTPESSKTLAFEEEGGVYILRIVLKQADSESDLRSSEQILIPSKVFNNYFGTYDNYLNSITSSMWLGNWMGYISQNILINRISLDFTRDIEITKDTVWNGFYILPGKNNKFAPSWVENKETGKKSIDWEQTIVDNIKTFKTTGDGYEWESTPTPFTYNIKLNELSPKINTYDGNTSINKLEGNLWNGIITSKLTLKTLDGQEIFTQDNDDDDDLQLIRELNFNCNTSSLGRVDKHNVVIPESFAFVNDSSRISKIKCSADQGSNDKRTRVELNVDETRYYHNTGWVTSPHNAYWNDNSKTVTDSNGPTFPLIGNLMAQSPATNWAYVTFVTGDNRSANSRVVLVRDTDEDDDKGGTTIDTDTEPVEGVILYATGGSSTLLNKTVFLKTTSSDFTKRILWALMHIKYGKNSESSTPVYYPTFQISNIVESEQLNISNFETDIQLRYLRVDDEMLLNNSTTLVRFNELLFKDPLISLSKTLNGSTPNILVILDYTTNNLYKEFITNITSGFMDYNQTQESKRTEVENTPVGDYLKYSEEGYEFPQGTGRNVFTREDFAGKKPSDINAIKSDAEMIISSLSKRTSADPYSISNIGYNNSSINTFKYLNKRGNNVVDNTSTAMMCYVQDITL